MVCDPDYENIQTTPIDSNGSIDFGSLFNFIIQCSGESDRSEGESNVLAKLQISVWQNNVKAKINFHLLYVEGSTLIFIKPILFGWNFEFAIRCLT